MPYFFSFFVHIFCMPAEESHFGVEVMLPPFNLHLRSHWQILVTMTLFKFANMA